MEGVVPAEAPSEEPRDAGGGGEDVGVEEGLHADLGVVPEGGEQVGDGARAALADEPGGGGGWAGGWNGGGGGWCGGGGGAGWGGGGAGRSRSRLRWARRFHSWTTL